MKRRSFVKRSSLLSVPTFLGGIPISAVANSPLSNFVNGESDRVLVLVQLNGGNDGLSMVVPRDQIDNLAQVRSNIFIPESSLINVTDTVAFHPSLTGLNELYTQENLKVIQSVGYPNQNRSHFRSTDIWNTASAANEVLTTGWMGRYFDSLHDNFPIGFPNEDCPDPFAITVGSIVSETCQGINGNFSMAIADPTNLSQLNSPVNNDLLDGCSGERMSFLNTSIAQTNQYTEVVTEAYDQGNNLSTKYSDDISLSNQLKTVARLISGGLQTKIYIVNLGGFDTHSEQVREDDTTLGVHSGLLKILSDSICAFQDDLKLLNLEKRVIGMTYSEFGRRIRSNDSLGTDHGSASPLMVFGDCITGGIVGDNPEIPLDVAANEGLPMQYDFRSVYGSILMDWFHVEEAEIQNLFPHDFQYIPMAFECNTTSTSDTKEEDPLLEVFPNPFRNQFSLKFNSTDQHIKISIFNTLGQESKILTNKRISSGAHIVNFDLSGFPNGAYFVRFQTRDAQQTIRIVKQ